MGEGEQNFKVLLPVGEGFRVRAETKDDMLPNRTFYEPEFITLTSFTVAGARPIAFNQR